MQRMKQFAAVTLFSFSLMTVSAQLNPTVSGDNMLCPEGFGTLTTQQFDTYQWYIRYFGSQTTNAIPGAISQTLNMDFYTYAASYLSVEVTSGAETDTSAEFFVDGWAFTGMTVMSGGNFTIGPNGETMICDGDSMYFEVLMPYDTNIQWYEGGQPIAGATNITFTVTEAGTYNVEGAPAVCPDFISNPGVDLVVLVENCSGAGISDPIAEPAQLFPVPALRELNIVHTSQQIREVEVTNPLGQIVFKDYPNQLKTVVPVTALGKGYYFITIRYDQGSETRSFIAE